MVGTIMDREESRVFPDLRPITSFRMITKDRFSAESNIGLELIINICVSSANLSFSLVPVLGQSSHAKFSTSTSFFL